MQVCFLATVGLFRLVFTDFHNFTFISQSTDYMLKKDRFKGQDESQCPHTMATKEVIKKQSTAQEKCFRAISRNPELASIISLCKKHIMTKCLNQTVTL